MLCFLIVSARTLVDEPKVYGSMRLVEAAERLLSLVDELGLHDEFLTEVRERLKLCPLENLPGEEGELVLRAPSVFQEYWNKPEETREAFLEIDGKQWLRTGDLARMDEDGYFFIVDRIKRMINRAGLKVWPAAVENTLYKHPAIKEACVVRIPDDRVGEEVKALIVLHEQFLDKITAEEIKAWSKEKLAAYEYPRVIEFVTELPKSSTGKILWKTLQ